MLWRGPKRAVLSFATLRSRSGFVPNGPSLPSTFGAVNRPPLLTTSSIRGTVKRMGEVALVRFGAASVARWVHRRHPVILAYHNVLPEGAPQVGERTLHLSRRSFARQLDILGETHEVVPLDRLWTAGGSGRPRAALTFDDAYLGALTVGVEEVVKRGMPATIFTCPGLLGGTAFWWDQLGEALDGVLPQDVRSRALWELRGRQGDILAWARGQGLSREVLEPYARAGEESDLTRAMANEGIRIASHTWSHPNLAALSPQELEVELREPIGWMEERVDRPLRWLSYPYGLENGEARSVARGMYEASLRVSGGRGPSEAPPPSHEAWFRLPRLNVPAGLSPENFELRLAGVVGG